MQQINNTSSTLPPIRRLRSSSSSERGSWNKVLTTQRKMSLELPQHREFVKSLATRRTTPTSATRKCEKEKVLCPRLARSLRNDGLELQTSKIREKTEMSGELVKTIRYSDSLSGDDPLILEGTLLLEKLDQSINSMEKLSPQSWIVLANCKLKLQRLLQEKVKSITEEDCLTLIQEGLNYARHLESIYTEDRYKLETALNLSHLPEKDRKRAIDDFMMTAEKRKGLPLETEEKIQSWVNSLNNSNRLININYRLPKERLCVLMVERTAGQLEKIKLTIVHWLALTLRTNIKIMAIYWDHLPFQCLVDLFQACSKFNATFPSDAINPVQTLAVTQAENASRRISFLVQSEAKKITSAKKKTMLEAVHSTPPGGDGGGGDSTSDYCTASSSNSNKSVSMIDGSAGRNESFAAITGDQVDLYSYLQIVLASSQRVVLKLSFLTHPASSSPSTSPLTPSLPPPPLSTQRSSRGVSSGRQTWSREIPDSRRMPDGSRIRHEISYWPVFWSTFIKKLSTDILFPSSCGQASSPIALSPENFQNLVQNSIRLTLQENDLPSEAVSEMKVLADELTYHLSDQRWLKNYISIYRMITDRSNQVFGRNDDVTYAPMVVNIMASFSILVQQKPAREALQVYQGCSVRQLESLLKLMAEHFVSISDKKPLKDLITLFKDIQPLDKIIGSLKSTKYPGNLDLVLRSFNQSLETLEEKITSSLYSMLIRTFVTRISQQRSKSSADIESIIPYVEHLILEPNLELLADCAKTKHFTRLRREMIASFVKVIHRIVLADGLEGNKPRLTRAIKNCLKREIAEFVQKHDTGAENGLDPVDEINHLRKLIENSQQSRDCLLFRKMNRIHPARRDWQEPVEASPFVNTMDLYKCGCFC